MLSDVRQKIRALVEDFEKSDFETFSYTISPVFTVAEDHLSSITKVLKNSVELGSGEYSFDSDTNKITVTVSLNSGDIIEVDYKYYKYSETELDEYIRASLVWISVSAYSQTDYEIENDDIYPTPDNKTLDLVSLISSILIKPDYTTYKLPNVTVIYNGRLPKDQKIQKLISRFKIGLGVFDTIEI